MALLTRTRRSSDPTGLLDPDVVERAREVSEQVADRARDVSGEVAERAAEAAERARAATAPTVARAREAAAPTVARAREASRPAARVSTTVGSLLRLFVRVVALVPGIAGQVLETVSHLLGRLADRSAELAHVEPPSRAGRRSRRRRAALWFAGGFVTGAAAGYAANEYLRSEHEAEHEHAVHPGTAGTPAAAPTTTHAVPGRG